MHIHVTKVWLALNLFIDLWNFHKDADKELPNLQPVFVTVDPLRDTPKAMKQYCEGMQEIPTFILIS